MFSGDYDKVMAADIIANGGSGDDQEAVRIFHMFWGKKLNDFEKMKYVKVKKKNFLREKKCLER